MAPVMKNRECYCIPNSQTNAVKKVAPRPMAKMRPVEIYC